MGAQRAGDVRGVHWPRAALPEDARQRGVPSAWPIRSRRASSPSAAERAGSARHASSAAARPQSRTETASTSGSRVPATVSELRAPLRARAPAQPASLRASGPCTTGRTGGRRRSRGGAGPRRRRRTSTPAAPAPPSTSTPSTSSAGRRPDPLRCRRTARGDRWSPPPRPRASPRRLEPLDRAGHERPELVAPTARCDRRRRLRPEVDRRLGGRPGPPARVGCGRTRWTRADTTPSTASSVRASSPDCASTSSACCSTGSGHEPRLEQLANPRRPRLGSPNSASTRTASAASADSTSTAQVGWPTLLHRFRARKPRSSSTVWISLACRSSSPCWTSARAATPRARARGRLQGRGPRWRAT